MDNLRDAVWHSARCANGNCLEVSFVGGQVALRDSKDPQGPVLHFATGEFDAFLRGVRGGEFDLDRR